MKIVLVALLYYTSASDPSAHMSSYVYSSMKDCAEDAAFLEAMLMDEKPEPSSYVVTYCIPLPREA